MLVHVESLYQEVGRRLREARQAAGLTQSGLAERVALSRTSITNIEQGRQRLTLDGLMRLAAVVGVAPGQLIPSGRVESPRIPPRKLRNLDPGEQAAVELVLRHAEAETPKGAHGDT